MGKVAKGAIAEANGEPFPVTYDGAVYTVPPPLNWPLDTLEELEAGHFTRALRMVLGDDQYEAFREKPRTLKDAVDLWKAISSTAGMGDLGNS